MYISGGENVHPAEAEFLEDLPRNATGKILEKDLRNMVSP